MAMDCGRQGVPVGGMTQCEGGFRVVAVGCRGDLCWRFAIGRGLAGFGVRGEWISTMEVRCCADMASGGVLRGLQGTWWRHGLLMVVQELWI